MARKIGTQSGDILLGTALNDDLEGLGGHDRLTGLAGHDDLEGGSGNDTLFGGAGHDDLEGDSGNDQLFGGAGRDDLEGGSGNDRLHGGAGADWLEGGFGDDLLTGGKGADVFEFGDDGETGHDVITDFTQGQDRLELDDFTRAEVQSVINGARQSGNHVVLTLSDDSTVTLRDTRLSQVDMSDFLF